MASYNARRNKQGEIISYQIKVSRGRDKLTGKQLTPYTMTFTPQEGWSKRTIERELLRTMGEFEAACKRGEVLTKEEQKQQAQDEINQAKQRAEEERRKPTFSKYVEIFLKEKSVNLSANTVIGYKRALESASEVFGNIKMEDITYSMVKDYFTDLQVNGKNRLTGKALNHSTVIQRYTQIHAFFESAIENEIIEISPMQKMKPPKASKNKLDETILAYDEETVKYILTCLDNESPKWRALILFAIDSGCRAGEIVGLKWSEIDFETGKVNICRNLQYIPNKGVTINTPKNGKSREIYVNEKVLAVLANWKEIQDKTFNRLGVKNKGFCFTRDDGELMRQALIIRI